MVPRLEEMGQRIPEALIGRKQIDWDEFKEMFDFLDDASSWRNNNPRLPSPLLLLEISTLQDRVTDMKASLTAANQELEHHKGEVTALKAALGQAQDQTDEQLAQADAHLQDMMVC